GRQLGRQGHGGESVGVVGGAGLLGQGLDDVAAGRRGRRRVGRAGRHREQGGAQGEGLGEGQARDRPGPGAPVQAHLEHPAGRAHPAHRRAGQLTRRVAQAGGHVAHADAHGPGRRILGGIGRRSQVRVATVVGGAEPLGPAGRVGAPVGRVDGGRQALAEGEHLAPGVGHGLVHGRVLDLGAEVHLAVGVVAQLVAGRGGPQRVRAGGDGLGPQGGSGPPGVPHFAHAPEVLLDVHLVDQAEGAAGGGGLDDPAVAPVTGGDGDGAAARRHRPQRAGGGGARRLGRGRRGGRRRLRCGGRRGGAGWLGGGGGAGRGHARGGGRGYVGGGRRGELGGADGGIGGLVPAPLGL